MKNTIESVITVNESDMIAVYTLFDGDVEVHTVTCGNEDVTWLMGIQETADLVYAAVWEAVRG